MPVYGFDEKDTRRVASAVRRVEAMPVDGPEDAGRNTRRITVRRAVVTTLITASSSTVAGIGAARLQRMDPVTRVYSNLMAGPVEVINEWTGSVPVGGIILAEVRGGRWYVQGYACP